MVGLKLSYLDVLPGYKPGLLMVLLTLLLILAMLVTLVWLMFKGLSSKPKLTGLSQIWVLIRLLL